MATKLPLDSMVQPVPARRVASSSIPKPLAYRQAGNPLLAEQGMEFGISNLGTRRIMTREQGRALEMIGHAVDYLNDSYIHDGPDNEVLDFRNSPNADAVRILIGTQRQIFRSLPMADPFAVRLFNLLLRRKRNDSAGMSQDVVPLSSSR
jgi:hypothetical protein